MIYFDVLARGGGAGLLHINTSNFRNLTFADGAEVQLSASALRIGEGFSIRGVS